MAGRAILATLALAAGLAASWGAALADHGECPPFERLRYDYLVEFNHGGDLFSTVHVKGYADFRFCFELRNRVLEEEIRWDARGGEYVLRVMGDGFEDTHVLRAGQNATVWYDHASVHAIQVAGLSQRGSPTIIAGEEPPTALASRLLGG